MKYIYTNIHINIHIPVIFPKEYRLQSIPSFQVNHLQNKQIINIKIHQNYGIVGITQATGTPASTETTLSTSSSDYMNSSMAMPVQMVEQPSETTKPSTEQYLGDLISGTYCSRIFSDCDRKKCRLQSPNFPGLYPRNLTCYYAVSLHSKDLPKTFESSS